MDTKPLSRSPLSRRLGVAAAATAVIVLAASPPAALGGRPSPLPPKVKPDVSAAGGAGVILPGAGTIAGPEATRLGFCGGDDWEPEIATDDLDHVYVVWTHFPGDPTCDPASANPKRVYIQVSSDGGRSFGPPRVVADRPDGTNYPSQVDSVVAVDDVTDAVHVSFLAYGVQGTRTDVIVATSTDFGRSFFAEKVNGPECKSCDHPWTVAHDGNVYVAYAHGKNHYLSRSADGGRTWRETNVLRADAVAFAEGAVVDARGNAFFAWGDCATASCRGKEAGHYRVSKTLAGTSRTTFTLVATAPAGPDCPYDPNCGYAYFGIQDDIAIDAAGTLFLVWQDGQVHDEAGSPTVVNLSRSSDGGRTWEVVGRADDKAAEGCAASACYALFPRIEGGEEGQINVMWMDDRLGAPLDHTNGWNVWLRTSNTGGLSWTGASRRVSTYDPRRPESRPNGFLFPYGDYEGIDLLEGDSTKAVMVWGEGFDYLGGPTKPGHVVYRSMPV